MIQTISYYLNTDVKRKKKSSNLDIFSSLIKIYYFVLYVEKLLISHLQKKYGKYIIFFLDTQIIINYSNHSCRPSILRFKRVYTHNYLWRYFRYSFIV